MKTNWEPALNNEGFTSVEAQEEAAGSLLAHYRSLINLRNDYPVFTTGGIIFLETGSRVVGYVRYFNNQQMIYVFHNLGQRAQEIKLEKGGGEWQVLYLSTGTLMPPINRGGEIGFNLPGYGTMIIKK